MRQFMGSQRVRCDWVTEQQQKMILHVSNGWKQAKEGAYSIMCKNDINSNFSFHRWRALGFLYAPFTYPHPKLYLILFKKYFICLAASHISCSRSSLRTGGSFSWGMWDLVLWAEMEPRAPALGARSFRHWTTREGPCCCSVASNSLWSHGLQHARLPCPSPSPGVCSDSYLLSQ